jgi:hypothetical protein
MVLGKGNWWRSAGDPPAPPSPGAPWRIAADPAFPRACVFAGIHDEAGRVEAPRGSSAVTGGMTVLLVSARSALGEVVDFFLRRASRQ